METRPPVELGHRRAMIDGFDLGVPGRTGTYVLREEELTLVDTGPSPSVPRILKGLEELGLDPADVRYVIVTHIHLDHAGGAGLLLESCPRAQVVVHPRGARHLADPSRLVAGARAIYQDQFDALFDPVVPVPKDRLIVKGDGDTLKIGPECTLTFLDSPGHAAHHFSIYDPASGGLFTGDTAGIRYHELEDCGFVLHLPVTSPNQFDPEAMRRSIERFRKMKAERIFFGHFGMEEQPEAVYEEVLGWLDRFVRTGESVFAEGGGPSEIEERLMEQVREHLRERKVPEDHPVYRQLKMDLFVSALGIVDYLEKKRG